MLIIAVIGELLVDTPEKKALLSIVSFCKNDIFLSSYLTTYTGIIIKTDIIEKTAFDEIAWVKYDGKASELYPANGNNVNFNQNDRRALVNLINGRQELRPTGELSNELFNTISKQMSDQIGTTVKNIVK
jgi:hypothetical protein